MIHVHDAPGGERVYSATLDDGRVYRVVVPEDSQWRHACTIEEYVVGLVGERLARGMYG